VFADSSAHRTRIATIVMDGKKANGKATRLSYCRLLNGIPVVTLVPGFVKSIYPMPGYLHFFCCDCCADFLQTESYLKERKAMFNETRQKRPIQKMTAAWMETARMSQVVSWALPRAMRMKKWKPLIPMALTVHRIWRSWRRIRRHRSIS
jgi:hypothetical protein